MPVSRRAMRDQRGANVIRLEGFRDYIEAATLDNFLPEVLIVYGGHQNNTGIRRHSFNLLIAVRQSVS